MLQTLRISNYAIISSVEIDFDKGLNIITGETGAGKSILLGALNLVLGGRAESKVLFDTEKKCIVEASFVLVEPNQKQQNSAKQLDENRLIRFFEEHDLDFEQTTIIRREITPAGKSRAFINDTPVLLPVLKRLTGSLINIHSQHDSLLINSRPFQFDFVDQVAGNGEKIKAFQTDFAHFKSEEQRLTGLKKSEAASQNERDYLQFQCDELQNADLEAEEELRLEEELNVATNSEELNRACSTVISELRAGETSIVERVRQLVTNLSAVENFSARIGPLNERLNSALLEMDDLADELESLDFSFDQERTSIVQDRLDELNRLMAKHQRSSSKALIELKDELDEKIDAISSISAEIVELEKQLQKLHASLLAEAKQVSKSRHAISKSIAAYVKTRLERLGMPEAQFIAEIRTDESADLHSNGIDQIQFLFSANKGFDPRPVKEVASGGELSRLMLALKSMIAEHSSLPTLVLDEIDTGVSGEVAENVGNIVREMSIDHQLIAITHLPQIAAKGNCHFKVFKSTSNERTNTEIKQLTEEERVAEIAKMLSGKTVSEAAMTNARELLRI